MNKKEREESARTSATLAKCCQPPNFWDIDFTVRPFLMDANDSLSSSTRSSMSCMSSLSSRRSARCILISSCGRDCAFMRWIFFCTLSSLAYILLRSFFNFLFCSARSSNVLVIACASVSRLANPARYLERSLNSFAEPQQTSCRTND